MVAADRMIERLAQSQHGLVTKAQAVDLGGHVRVGLEDYGGDHQPTNVDLVGQAVDVITAAGCRPASPDEAAEILGMPR